MSSDYQHKGRKRRSLERKVSAHSSEERERERGEGDETRGEERQMQDEGTRETEKPN